MARIRGSRGPKRMAAAKRKAAPQKARDVSRRLGRQHSKKRASGEKRPSRLLAGVRRWGLGVGLVFLAFALTAAGLLGAYGALAGSEAFLVRQAQVTGTSHLSRLEVLRVAGIGAKSNLLSLQVGRLEQRIAALGWVEQASVSRSLPGLVTISVREKTPRALALVAGKLHCLDGDLRAFASVDAGAAPDLPVITGLSQADLKDPDDEALALMRSARALLDLMETEPPPGLGRLSEVHLDAIYGLTLVFEQLAPVVRVGHGDFRAALAGLRPVMQDLRARGELGRALIIDLQAPQKAVVRISGESA